MAKTGSMNLGKFLKDANKHRKAVAQKRKEQKYDEFDDGSYIARAVKLEIAQSGAGNMQAITHWKFVEGEYKGKIKKSFQRLVDADSWFYFEQDLKRMGFDVDQIDDYGDDIPKIMSEIEKEKPVCRIALKTSGDFQNVRVRRLLDDDEVEESGGDEEEEETDDEETEESEEEESDDEEEADDEEEEKPKKKAKGKGKKDDDDEEEESEEEEADDEEEESSDDEEEEAEEEDESEEVALTIGSLVKVKTKDGVKTAEVLDIDEKDNKMVVKTKDGKKLKLSAEKIVEVLEAEEPKKKAKDDGKKKAKKK